jgi:hypothetical protein
MSTVPKISNPFAIPDELPEPVPAATLTVIPEGDAEKSEAATAIKPHLSSSSLGMKCMEQFRRRYIEKEIIAPGVALIVGIGTHESVRSSMRHKIDTGELAPLQMITDTARDSVNKEWESQGVRLQPEEVLMGMSIVRGEAVDKAVRLSRLHLTKYAPAIRPKSIERPWKLEIEGFPFDVIGRTDIEEVSTVLRDTKTSKKTPEKECAHKSIQLKLYSLAMWKLNGVAPKKAILDYLIDTKEPKIASFEMIPSVEIWRSVLNRVEVIADAWIKGVFVPVEPGHWCCSPDWCGYYDSCKYVLSPKTFALKVAAPDYIPKNEYAD